MKFKKDLVTKKLITFNSWFFNGLISEEEFFLLRRLLNGGCMSQVMRLNKKNLRRELDNIKLNLSVDSVNEEVFDYV